MKKLMIVLVFVLLLSGCEATYTVEISKDKFEDHTKIYDESIKYQKAIESEEQKEQIINTLYEFEKVNPFSFEREFFEENLVSGFSYTSTFPIHNGYDNWPSLAGQCYPYYDFYTKDNILIIKTAPNFTCFQKYNKLDKVNVEIKTNYHVLSHNADHVKDDIYTWELNKENTLNEILYKPIMMQIEYTEKENQEKKSFSSSLVISILSVIAASFLLYMCIIKFNKKDEM